MTGVLTADARGDTATLAGLTLRPHPTAAAGGRPLHAFTMDVEDWQQSVFDARLPVSQRFVVGVGRAVELLDRHRVKGTFFVLANAARAAPSLIRELAAAGHEIQTHGCDHTPVHRLSREAFRQDVLRAKGTLEDVIGRPIYGYRAPRFSIDRETLWALDVLAECGIAYDSSIFPLRIRGYGIAGWPLPPVRVRTPCGGEIIEAPVAAGRLLGRAIPVGGGGYFRLLPRAALVNRLRRIDAEDRPIVLYCHPHEFDPAALREMPVSVPLGVRLHQGLGRSGFAGKMEAALTSLPFGTMSAVLQL